MAESELTKHTVPATAAGFLFQFRRAVAILAEAPNGVVVGIETLDDVASEYADGALVLEQDKFTTGSNPLGDSSKNLLGTLSTWLAALLAGEISLENTRFLLVTNAVCRDGLVRQIADASSQGDAQGCLDAVLGMSGTSETKQNLLALLARPEGKDMFMGLCQAVQLVDGEKTSDTSAAGCLQIPTAFEPQRTIIFDALCGWIDGEALRVWKAKEPCRIGKQAFTNQLDAILNKLKREKRQGKPEGQLPVSKAEIAGLQDAVFARQIDLVTDEPSYKTEAICDYLRCINEKNRLSKEGEITDGDWIDFSDRLERRWSNIWRRNKASSAGPEKAIGYQTMMDVLAPDYHPDLAGEPTTQVYLANGTYHRLSDAKTIGWHPRYRELLEKGETDGHSV